MKNKFSHDVFISFSFKDQALADKIVNQLMNKYQIPCWICTEQIRAGDYYYDDIADAISASKILVFVQTKNSVESKEIPDEVLTAIDEGKIIISFIVDDSELRGQMKLKLKHRQHIDARKPELDDRIEELARELCLLLDLPFGTEGKMPEEAKPKARLVATPNVIPKTIFCGREDIISEIHEKYQDGERVLFLHGIGGIGKTQIAKQYAKQYKNDYDAIVYATYNGSLKEIIVAESPFVLEPELIRYTLSNGLQESDDAFFARKLEIIQRISSERTLIIIDNFDVEDDENLLMFMNGKYHLLITTRCDYSRFYPTIEIHSIDSIEALKEIFMRNYKGGDVDRDDPALVELIELVNRHTYTIELLAQHMENSGQTPTEMIAALKERGITSLNEEVRNSDMKTQIAYENLLKMFKIFSLNEEERQILMYLSLMPIEGVDVKDFKKWAGLKSSRLLNNLENRSWIVRNTEGIALHPIIKEIVKHEMPASEENCIEFINAFNDSICEKVAWHLKKTEKDRLSFIAKNIIAIIKDITENTEDLYYHTESLWGFSVDPQFAEVLAKRLYDYYLNSLGELSFKTGRAAFKLGWLYSYNSFLSQSIQNAFIWLETAKNILTRIELNTDQEKVPLSQTYVNLAKMHLNTYLKTNNYEDYVKAKQYAQQTILFTTSSFTKDSIHYAKIAGAHWQLADVLLVGGETSEALKNIDIALDILISLYTENDGDTMHALNRKAMILYKMNRFDEAKKIAQKSALGYVEFFGENNVPTINMQSLLGDCCAALGEYDNAKEAYKKALDIAERLYVPEAQQILDLQAKLNQH